MAKETVTRFTSDISGQPIEGESAEVRIKLGGKLYVLDALPEEVSELASKGKETAVPGRKSADDGKAK